jgi:hypothetical protein
MTRHANNLVGSPMDNPGTIPASVVLAEEQKVD